MCSIASGVTIFDLEMCNNRVAPVAQTGIGAFYSHFFTVMYVQYTTYVLCTYYVIHCKPDKVTRFIHIYFPLSSHLYYMLVCTFVCEWMSVYYGMR